MLTLVANVEWESLPSKDRIGHWSAEREEQRREDEDTHNEDWVDKRD